jgi:hypothetical protein
VKLGLTVSLPLRRRSAAGGPAGQRPAVGQRGAFGIVRGAAVEGGAAAERTLWSGPALAIGAALAVVRVTLAGALSTLPSLTINWAT